MVESIDKEGCKPTCEGIQRGEGGPDLNNRKMPGKEKSGAEIRGGIVKENNRRGRLIEVSQPKEVIGAFTKGKIRALPGNKRRGFNGLLRRPQH